MINSKILLAVLPVLVMVSIPSVFAEPVKFANFDLELIGYTKNGQPITQWTSTPEKIITDYDVIGNPKYSYYKLFENANFVRVETENSGSIVFDKNTCSFDYYDSGFIGISQPKLKDVTWSVKGKANSSSTWSNLNTINGATCNTVVSALEKQVTITSSKTVLGQGVFAVEMKHTPGAGFKVTMKGYNDNPAWTNHNIGFTEKIGVPQIITLGDMTYDLSQYDGTILGRTWIQNHKAQLIKLTDTIQYDSALGFKNLDKITISWDGSQAWLSIDYLYQNSIVPYQQWFEVDPTYSSNNPTVDGYVSDDDNDNNCEASPAIIGKDTSNARIESGRRANSEGSDCSRGFSEYDISSLSTTIDVLDSDFQFAVGQIVDTPNGCDFVSMSSQPSVATDSNIWSAIGSGTVLVDNNSLCNSSGNNKSVDLGSNGDSYIESQRGSSLSWAAIGVKSEVEGALDGSFHLSRIASEENATATPKPTLVITYTTGTLPTPTNLIATSQGTQVAVSWSITNASNVDGYYIGKSLDNATWPGSNKTVIGNITSTTLSSYFRPGLLYYLNVTSAITGVLNATYSAYTSFTMDNVPNAPTLDLTTIDLSTVNATSTAGASDGGDTVDDFGLRCEKNGAGGWLTIVANFSLPTNRSFSYGGNTGGDSIVCQWRDGNDVGWSDWSTNATIILGEPDPVDDLVATIITTLNAELDWTTPDMRGGTCVGYQINYSTPQGDPMTIIENNTNDCTTTYMVSGLTGPNNSFRIGVWNNVTGNPNGNIANTTGISFTIGDVSFNSTNSDVRDIKFERTNINDTMTQLNVTYDNGFTLNCDFDYKFAQSNRTYSNITGSAINSDEDEASFYFNNSNNDIITAYCYDTITNSSGRYILTQSSFLLMQQIENFRNGTYGTMGMFGAFDLVTLIGIIIAMIGLNRVNESVGGVFTLIVIGVLTYFEIIEPQTSILASLALIILIIVTTTRKD